jgi:hypothetical protein
VGLYIPIIASAFKENTFRKGSLGEFEGQAGFFQSIVNRVVHSTIVVEKDEKGKRKSSIKERIIFEKAVDYSFIV